MTLADEIRDAIASIPAGHVASYGDVGAAVGAGARQVGSTMRLLDVDVAWWRVVRADGTPASCHAGTAPELLRDEGTAMRGTRVDMAVARFRPKAPPDGAASSST